jgi:hypothetical protein
MSYTHGHIGYEEGISIDKYHVKNGIIINELETDGFLTAHKPEDLSVEYDIKYKKNSKK